MSQSDTPNYLNRRNFLGNSVAAGLAGLALVETVGAWLDEQLNPHPDLDQDPETRIRTSTPA